MSRCRPALPSASRRTLLWQLAAAPLLGQAAPLAACLAAVAEPLVPASAAPQPDLRYSPHYPVPSPLEDVLRLVPPGLDQFPSERTAAALEGVLARWAAALEAGRFEAAAALFTAQARVSPWQPLTMQPVRERHGLRCEQVTYAAARAVAASGLPGEWTLWLGAGTRVTVAEFQLTALDPHTLGSAVRYSLTLLQAGGAREQRVGTWQVRWQKSADSWQVAELAASTERRSEVRGPGFLDITAQALGRNPSALQQLRNGSDFWRTTLDGACGLDVYGNNGIAAGDFNNDGLDDFYVSQPAGLPNRLFRNRGDGTFEDVTERAGVGVLDNTACALFADFRNMGLQDLLVVTGAGPLLFLNRGDGTFAPKPDAFHFAQPPAGTFTHAAVADYDRDGRLDIYFCLYSYYLGLDQYHYPAPYFDARNGPPNFLLRNQGDGTFTDVTASAGLNVQNNRYSFSCAWNETGGNDNGKGHPDLYVVNDFGRNNLYRSRGDGTFEEVSEAAHVQDVGAGMSAAWGDYAGTGREGIYAANMWSAAGQRVSSLPAFHPDSSAAVRRLYTQHSHGNTLYRNDGNGTFANVTEQAAVEMGRWAWGSDFLDLDQDGHPDLLVTNGYISAPAPAEASTSRVGDLGSFFWRQVVGRSPDDSTPSQGYEHGWNALNELIRTDLSWSGHERNVCFVNNGDGTFTEASGPLGLDFLEDGRSFALADLDGDGRLEILLKNRNGPQLRILRNALAELGDSISFRLRGTRSNRDGIGAVVTVRTGTLVQRRSLQAGTGFLSQHGKALHFGLGSGHEPVTVEVLWPSGLRQQFGPLARNTRVDLVEGEAEPKSSPFAATAHAWLQPASAPAAEAIPGTFATWLLDPLPAPGFTLAAQSGPAVSLNAYRGRPVLLHLWEESAPSARVQLHALDAIPPGTLAVLALNLDEPDRQSGLPRLGLRLPVLLATPELAGVYNLVFRYLHDRRADLPVPTSFLLDTAGRIVRVYQGPVEPVSVLADVRAIPADQAARTRLALPFPGQLYLSSFTRNTFTYGVAFFQHGYLDEAAEAFAQSVATDPANAEAHYNLGTLALRRHRLPEAQSELEQTVKLKPTYAEAWNNLGMVAAESGDSAAARSHFEQALTLRPDYPTALLNLGALLRHAGELAAAEPYLTRAAALAPGDPEAAYALGMLRAQQGQASAAAELLKKAIALRPDYPEALNNLGVLYARGGDNARAEQHFLLARERSPAYEPTYMNLARLYVAQGDRAKAREAVAALLKRNPENAQARQALQALGPE